MLRANEIGPEQGPHGARARFIMALLEVGLDDKYRLDAKRIFLSGTQALVRLPMLQRERDRAAGLNTAGFISGYRGSPCMTTRCGAQNPSCSSTTSPSSPV